MRRPIVSVFGSHDLDEAREIEAAKLRITEVLAL